ncbi:outer membrane beta-barrel protein [Saccharicrinis aurantiacus]|uniref:outer membrane beta-barrel protein n=1 Tax=Saccharicrinis aurantiacus TaxID=1849719 RepID=UPI002491BB65|nr:outer membrane beta-barrel protein [Saccharicrinis aurantiacus]
MEKNILFVIMVLLSINIIAQEKSNKTNIVIIDDNNETVVLGVSKAKVEVNNENDTITKITLGHKRFDIIEGDDKTKVNMVHLPREKFKGHYAGVQLGFCSYFGPDFSNTMPEGGAFMEPNKGKSMAFSINFLQYNIGLQKHKKNIGLVTGMGWTVYNYRTDNQYKIMRNESGITVGEPIAEKVTKNKIVSNYINIPLLLEAQIPSSTNRSTAFISAGVYGGFKIGSHTKTVTEGNNKSKSKENINLNPIQYGAMVQLGYKFIKLYATYNFSSLYEKNKGPELYPYSIGLTLVNF